MHFFKQNQQYRAHLTGRNGRGSNVVTNQPQPNPLPSTPPTPTGYPIPWTHLSWRIGLPTSSCCPALIFAHLSQVPANLKWVPAYFKWMPCPPRITAPLTSGSPIHLCQLPVHLSQELELHPTRVGAGLRLGPVSWWCPLDIALGHYSQWILSP
jgi:hypothetical protein